MTRVTLPVLFTLLCAIIGRRQVHAGSVGATMAALPDEASECRYYVSVCEAAKRGPANAQRTRKAWEDALSNALKEGTGSPNAAWNAEQLDRLHTRFNAAMAVGYQAINDCAEAEQVLRAKHATVPACVTERQGQHDTKRRQTKQH